MDLLATCRSCLQCLPFFQVSSPSSPQPTTTTTLGPSSSSRQETASKASDPGEYTQSSAGAGQDLVISGKVEEPHLPLYSRSDLQDSIIAEDEDKPLSEIIIAPPVCSPSSSIKSTTGASTHEDAEPIKTPSPSELPLHVPFINDISFSTSGLMPLPSPMTPAPFGAGYPAGQYYPHPSPHIYPPAFDDSHDSKEPPHDNPHVEHVDSHDGHDSKEPPHDNPHVEHVDSHDGHGPSHHGHGDLHDGHVDSHVEHVDLHDGHHHGHGDLHQGHNSSHHGHLHHGHLHHGHSPPDESHAPAAPDNTPSAETSDFDSADAPDATNGTSPVPLGTSYSTSGYLDTEGKQEGENGATGDTGGDSALIETYNSEPIILSGVPEDDDINTPEEGLSAHPSRRRRRLKEQFKGFRQQIKQGGHQLKKEGSKHLQTIVSNMNKQAQQIEQSGSFYMVPRANNS